MTAPTRPTLAQLIDRIQADIEYHLPGASARAAESLLNTLSEANAGAFHGLYGYAEYLARQQLPDTADLDWLGRWAIALEVPRLAPTYATGLATATGSGVMPVGTVLMEPLTRRLYQVAEGVDVSETAVPVTAVEPGYAGNLDAGTLLHLKTPVAGIGSDLAVVSLGGGADLESEESWRRRVVRKLAERSKIGDADDYALWAESAHPAIDRAWVYPHEMGLGTVVIRCVGAGASPLLDNQVLAEAQQQLDALRNAGATVFLLAAEARTINLIISGITDAAMQAAILLELDLLFRVKRQRAALLRESEIDAAIQRHTLEYTLISPVGDTQCTDKEVLVLGDVTWLA